jgi:hypothetical protein
MEYPTLIPRPNRETVTGLLKGVAGVTPLLGDAITGWEAEQARRAGRYGEAGLLAGLSALGLIPGFGGITKLPYAAPFKNIWNRFSPSKELDLAESYRMHTLGIEDTSFTDVAGKAYSKFLERFEGAAKDFLLPQKAFSETKALPTSEFGHSWDQNLKRLYETNPSKFAKRNEHFDKMRKRGDMSKEFDNLSDADIASMKKQYYDATQDYLHQLGVPEGKIAVYRRGDIGDDSIVSFSLDPGFSTKALPWVHADDPLKTLPVDRYLVDRKDIISAPNALFPKSYTFSDEAEVLINPLKVKKIPTVYE